MNRKEIREIKSQFSLENCGILRLCGCYIDGEKNKVAQFNENFLNLPEEEQHKYFDIFKKTLSGTSGKNLINMKFNIDSYAEDGARELLIKLRDSGLKDESLLNRFYENVINHYSYVGNYLILLINQVYDVPGKASDGTTLDDASDEVYNYILCSICNINLSEPGLGYDESDNNFHDNKQSHLVGKPEIGFLFPSFNNRSADDDMTLLYTKNTKKFDEELINSILDCSIPLSAEEQNNKIIQLIDKVTSDSADLNTVKNIQGSLQQLIEDKKDSGSLVILNKTDIRDILKQSGIEDIALQNFEEYFMMDLKDNQLPVIAADNISISKELKVEMPDVVIKVNPKKSSIITTKNIDGKRCIVIEMGDNVQVNGISIK